ncbi:23S rRNA (uracil(1939)-C(5))-methyltransferase RlmD [Alcanivorax sp. ALC70]|nr:23S rRNA (uracil(1939)-C(5))-methyltransferase RlmD [Alcanivorax sp. ALC70]
MGRRRKKKLPEMPVAATIESLSHDGRGIARLDGKTTFIDNALPGEQVFFQYTYMRRKFDEGRAVEILEASPDRVEPPCAHALICGGCSLQHVAPASQIRRKEAVLAEQLAHFGGLQPESWLAPLTGPVTGYRGKARMGAKFIDARGETLVGFREKRNSFIADLHRCEVLIPEVGHRLDDLRALMDGLESRHRIPQIEVARGDDAVALVFRHLDPLPAADLAKLVAFCQDKGLQLYLQPGNESTVHRVWPEQGEERLYYRHAPTGRTRKAPSWLFTPRISPRSMRRSTAAWFPWHWICWRSRRIIRCLICSAAWATSPSPRRAARPGWWAWKAATPWWSAVTRMRAATTWKTWNSMPGT